jgi:hypothetical protein
MIAAGLIRGTLCRALSERFSYVANTSPTATSFARDPSGIPEHVLVRHALEHVFRIRMFRRLDAFAARRLRDVNDRIGDAWAAYARSEAVHDRYFLRDLRAIGVDRETVEAVSPFTATSRLVGFVDVAARAYGPLPVVLYSFLAEQSSEVGSPPIIARNVELFGKDAARGASAHRNLDHNLDHVGVICNILAAILRDTEDLVEAMRLLEMITDLIGEYFGELDGWSCRVSTSSGDRCTANFAWLYPQT